MIVGKYKKYCHKFQYTQGRFLFVLFCFAIYKWFIVWTYLSQILVSEH